MINIILYYIMIPIPLILVSVVCGSVVLYMIVESCYVSVQNIRKRMKRKHPLLSSCDENTLNKINKIDNTNDLL